MAENITKIASSYDMVDIMRDIAKNYFDADLSEQRIGMFGYTTEAMANMFGATILDASNRQQEYSVYTAKKRSTLLYEGAKYDVNVDNANPNRMSAYVGILTSSIINPASKGGFGTPDYTNDRNNPNYTLVIEKGTIYNIANYNFMVEHDILISATYTSSNKYTYSVRYLFEGDIDKTSDQSNYPNGYIVPRAVTAYDYTDKYIQSYIKNYSDSLNILLFKVNLVQVTKKSSEYHIVKNDMVSLTGLEFDYDNQLSHFNIYYRKNNNSDWVNVLTVPYYLSDETYDEDIIYYEVLHDERKIKISMTDFVPAYNSDIRVEIYSTSGSEVNGLEYNGNGSDITISMNSIDERHSYVGLQLNCMPISSAIGGSDVPTLEELRKKVIIARSTSNSISTETDLVNYMNSIDTTNDYVFIKKRNDILERRYSCYTIPRMIQKDIIPSSTLNLCIPNFISEYESNDELLSNIDSENNIPGIVFSSNNKNKTVTIKAGTPFVLKNEIENYAKSHKGDNNKIPILDNSKYAIPINILNNYYYSDYKDTDEIHNCDIFDHDNSLIALDMSEKYTYNKSDGEQVDEYKFKVGPKGIYYTIDNTLLEDNIKVYTSPYTILYDITNRLPSFYNSSISESLPMNMIDENKEAVVNFSIDSLDISRNTISENQMDSNDGYLLSLTLIANGDISYAQFGEASYVNSGPMKNSIIVKGIIYKASSGNDQTIGYIDFEYDEKSSNVDSNMFKFKGYIKIDDSLSQSESSFMTKITNIHGSKSQYGNIAELIDNTGNVKDEMAFIPINDLRISIGCYYLNRTYNNINYDEITSIETNDVIMPVLTDDHVLSQEAISDTKYRYYKYTNTCKYNNIECIENYVLTNVYDNSANLIDLYTDMSKHLKSVSSELSNIENDIELKAIHFSEVPVIKYSSLLNTEINTRVVNIINNTHETLSNLTYLITNNFGIDYKFFRTYGPCQYFKLQSMTNNEYKNLGNLDIKIRFSALIKTSINISENDILSRLKTYIKSRIEEFNNNAENSDYTMYLSNIITDIENEFNNYIRSIELVSINNESSDYRILKYNKPDISDHSENASNDAVKYIPEYINVPIENITIDVRR